MRLEGLAKVPVVGPSSTTDYIDIPLPKAEGAKAKMKMQQVLFKGIHAADLLEDILRRYRPYAVDKEQTDALKGERLEALGAIIADGAELKRLVEWGHETVAAFKAVPLRYQERFPLVLYIGEIYMRQHDPYTDFVIHRLEDNQLEIVRDPITDWLFYVNRINLRNARRDASLGLSSLNLGRVTASVRKASKSLLKSHYMNSVAEKLDEPFHEALEGRHVLPHPMEIIETLEQAHEIHGNIEGESPLSTGIAYYFMRELIQPHGDACISGVFHVGPFTCMQEGVATAKIEGLIKEYRKTHPDLVFPIIHAFFGDSPNANLAAEIAVFKEQCYQKRDLLRAQQLGPRDAQEIRAVSVGSNAAGQAQVRQ
jgi:predicted nucleotide-binding protein (sugar kinase/HSP70/actin superfamily)